MIKLRNILFVVLLAAVTLPIVAGSKKDAAVSEENRRKAEYIFLEAENQRNVGKISSFYDLTRYAHSLDPTNPAISYYLGYCLLTRHDVTRGEFAEGLKLMRPYVDLHPKDYYELIAYADANMALGQDQEGMRVNKILAGSFPNKLDIQVRLADGYARLGDYRNAIATYDSIEHFQGQSSVITARKVQAYQALNDTLGALKEMRSLLKSAPKNADYNLAMANMMMMFGKNDSALHYIDLAQQYEPENGNTYLAKAQYYNAIGDTVNYDAQTYKALVSKDLDVESKVDVLADYASHLLAAGDSSARTTGLFDVLLEQHPHEPTIRQLYSEYLSAKEDYKGAAEQMELALDLDPTNAKSWHRLLLLDMMAEDYPAAVKAGDKAIELNPDSIRLYSYIAPAYYEMKQYDKALETYSQALTKVDSSDVEMRSSLIGGKGDVYFALNDTVKAFETYEEALKVNPNNTSIMNNYAYYLSLAGKDLAKAERMSGKAVQSNPENSTFVDTYAWVFFKEKVYSMALFYIENAVKNDASGSADILDHYGDILWMSGNHDKAVEQWTKALEKDPKNELLQRKVQDKTYYEK